MSPEPMTPDPAAVPDAEGGPAPTTTKGTTLTARGLRTRARLLEAAETVFAAVGYPEASIVKITEEAGCGLGTFYLYFGGKQEIFDEVVRDLNRRVRRAMADASRQETDRIAAERAGFRAFFRFTAEHPALYRIIRQAEFASPQALRGHYAKIVGGYADGLRQGQAAGEVHRMDPEVAAWALMGIGEIIGMRWVLWPAQGMVEGEEPAEDGIPDDVFETMMEFIERALAPGTPGTSGAPDPAERHRP